MTSTLPHQATCTQLISQGQVVLYICKPPYDCVHIDSFSGTITNHEFQLVAAVAADIKTIMEVLLDQSSAKITVFAKMEKQASQFAEAIADKCEAMVDQVTRTAEEKVTHKYNFNTSYIWKGFGVFRSYKPRPPRYARSTTL